LFAHIEQQTHKKTLATCRTNPLAEKMDDDDHDNIDVGNEGVKQLDEIASSRSESSDESRSDEEAKQDEVTSSTSESSDEEAKEDEVTSSTSGSSDEEVVPKETNDGKRMDDENSDYDDDNKDVGNKGNSDYDDDNKDVGRKGVKQVDEVTSSHSESSDEEGKQVYRVEVTSSHSESSEDDVVHTETDEGKPIEGMVPVPMSDEVNRIDFTNQLINNLDRLSRQTRLLAGTNPMSGDVRDGDDPLTPDTRVPMGDEVGMSGDVRDGDDPSMADKVGIIEWANNLGRTGDVEDPLELAEVPLEQADAIEMEWANTGDVEGPLEQADAIEMEWANNLDRMGDVEGPLGQAIAQRAFPAKRASNSLSSNQGQDKPWVGPFEFRNYHKLWSKKTMKEEHYRFRQNPIKWHRYYSHQPSENDATTEEESYQPEKKKRATVPKDTSQEDSASDTGDESGGERVDVKNIIQYRPGAYISVHDRWREHPDYQPGKQKTRDRTERGDAVYQQQRIRGYVRGQRDLQRYGDHRTMLLESKIAKNLVLPAAERLELTDTEEEIAEGLVRFGGLSLGKAFGKLQEMNEDVFEERSKQLKDSELVHKAMHWSRAMRSNESEFVRRINLNGVRCSPLSTNVDPRNDLEDLVRWWGLPVLYAYLYVEEEWNMLERERRAILLGPRGVTSTGVDNHSTRLMDRIVRPLSEENFNAALQRYTPLAEEEARIQQEVEDVMVHRENQRQWIQINRAERLETERLERERLETERLERERSINPPVRQVGDRAILVGQAAEPEDESRQRIDHPVSARLEERRSSRGSSSSSDDDS
jgi:hypothetical protein